MNHADVTKARIKFHYDENCFETRFLESEKFETRSELAQAVTKDYAGGREGAPKIWMKFDGSESTPHVKERCKLLWQQIYKNSKLRRMLGIPHDGNKTTIRDTVAAEQTKRNVKPKTEASHDKHLQQWSISRISHWMRMLENSKKQLVSGQQFYKSIQPSTGIICSWEIIESMRRRNFFQDSSLTSENYPMTSSISDDYKTDKPADVYKSKNDFEKRMRNAIEKEKFFVKKPAEYVNKFKIS